MVCGVCVLGDGVSVDESEAGDGEESVAGGIGHDASSTATIGSNLLYLSDEQVSAYLHIKNIHVHTCIHVHVRT